MDVQWHLVNGITGQRACSFLDEKKANDWLEKQLREFPNGYYYETKARIDRVPPLPGKIGQLDLFEYFELV